MLVNPFGAENTTIGPNSLFFLRVLIRSNIAGIFFPSSLNRLPPNLITESVLISATTPIIDIWKMDYSFKIFCFYEILKNY